MVEFKRADANVITKQGKNSLREKGRVMSKKLPKVDHWSIEIGDIDAFVELYNATPIAQLPENWVQIYKGQYGPLSNEDAAISAKHTRDDYRSAPPLGPVEITLPEVMQCFKTLVHFDWIKDLGSDLVAEGVLDFPYEDFWLAKWPLEEPYDRGSAVGLLQGFLRWWPVWCGYDVMTGEFGRINGNYSSVMTPVYRAVFLKITYDEPQKIFHRENFGGVVEGLRKYGVQQ